MRFWSLTSFHSAPPPLTPRPCGPKYAVADEVLVCPALITSLAPYDERNTTHVKAAGLDSDQDLTVIPEVDVIRSMAADECAFVEECVTLHVLGGLDITVT